MNLPPLTIEIPAWGPYYVGLACQYTVPAVLASLAESEFRDVTFLVHTDDQASFRTACGGYPMKFLPMLPVGPIPKDQRLPRLPDNYWVAFKKTHKDAIAATPAGGIVALLNSDIVVSRECFAHVAQELVARGKKTVVSVGIRTLDGSGEPPIGASAEDLFRWCWAHRHPLTDGVIWGSGKSVHPTILYFDDGAGNVAMHGFHLTPMFIRKDRDLRFSGTIDDDLLGAYQDNEISFLSGGEVAFAEISPAWKTHPQGRSVNVPDIIEFWRRRAVRPHYLRNFRQRMRIMGDPPDPAHPVIGEIIETLSRIPPSVPAAPRERLVRAARSPRQPVNDHRPGSGNQDEAELQAFLDLVRDLGVRSYLEIGCRNGYSLWHVMRAIGPGGRAVAIDLVENDRTQANLTRTAEELRAQGSDVRLIWGDSQSPIVIEMARAAAPFDLVLIDADHRYESVARDFEAYRHMGRIVALHDVAAPDGHMSDGHVNGVGRFWRGIRGGFRVREIETPGSCMGFGIVFDPAGDAKAAAC